MIKVDMNVDSLVRDLQRIATYSEDFMGGAKAAEPKLLERVGRQAIEEIKEYIDSMARVDPELLHHVYEWHQEGNASSRLFDIEFTIVAGGLSINSTFRQSTSIQNGGGVVPFYDKARVMEEGVPVTIKPVRAKVLAFQPGDSADTVFTKGPVYVESPGGERVRGAYEETFRSFFRNYFSQSTLTKLGLSKDLKNPVQYKLASAKSGMNGFSDGYRWISTAGGLL
jgi:hypothetical protein